MDDERQTSFTTVERKTLSDGVYEQIRNAIINGEFEEDSELSQVEFAERFGVSRVPVREALRQLQAEQLLTARAFKRYVVTSLNPKQIFELMEIREELEVFALHRTMGALREGRIDIGQLQQVVSHLNIDADGEKWLKADIEFHAALSRGAPQAARMVEDIRVRIHRYLRVAVVSADRRKAVIGEHREIIQAIVKDDENAALDHLRKHVAGTREMLQTYLENRVKEPSLSPRAPATSRVDKAQNAQ